MASSPPPCYAHSAASLSRSRTEHKDVEFMTNAMLEASLTSEKSTPKWGPEHYFGYAPPPPPASEKQGYGSYASTPKWGPECYHGYPPQRDSEKQKDGSYAYASLPETGYPDMPSEKAKYGSYSYSSTSPTTYPEVASEKHNYGSYAYSSTAPTAYPGPSLKEDLLRKVELAQDNLLRIVQEERTNAAEMQHLARRERALAERLQREGASAQTGALSDADVRNRVKQLKRDTKTAHAELSRESSAGMFKNVCSTDLLFLIDTSSSMDPYIYVAWQQILYIVHDVKRYFLGEAEVRVAVVGYKDHDQDPNIQILDFTSSIDEVHEFLGNLEASGRSDTPKDVLGGIRWALNASWKQQTRCIIHIADKPPHGRHLYDYMAWGDPYPDPGSEPHGLTYQPLIQEMIDLNINYALLRIGSATDRMAYEFFRTYAAANADGMLHQFNKYYDRAYNARVGIQFGSQFGGYSERKTKSGLLFKEADIGTKFNVLRNLIVSIVTDSASRTAVRTSERRTGRSLTSKKKDQDLFTINEHGQNTQEIPLERSHPQWDVPGWLDDRQMVQGFSLDTVAHGTDNLNSMMEKDDNIKISVSELTIERRSRPFAQGAMRRAFYTRTAASTNLYVAKSHIRPGKSLPHLVEDMRCQALSKAFALEFNALVDDHPIDFTTTTCFKSSPNASPNTTTHKTSSSASSSDYMSLEPYIEGTYVKYNSNSGYTTDQNPHDRTNIAAQAFSHFTFERSQGRFLVCDLQGVGYQFSDPSIHTLDPKRFRLSDTNLGPEGFKFFFASHVCNDICLRLDLKSSAEMLRSGSQDFRTDWPHIGNTVCCANKLCGKIVRMDEHTRAHVRPGLFWCAGCEPQLYMFRSRAVCAGGGGARHEFEVSTFFHESQGERAPRVCEEHRGADKARSNSSLGSHSGMASEKPKKIKVKRLSAGLWARLKSGSVGE